ncbi:MAG: hypothetical protein FJZ57_01270 [Chlamydiae bacterium]|nr:hypothetical protein [Chlamydiota bacterium]
MRILVQHPYRPFSHVAGSSCVIPYTSWKLTAYPTRVRLEDLFDQEVIDVRFSFEGPVQEFTVQQNLEKGVVQLFGMSRKGYFRIVFELKSSGIYLSFEKLPEGEVKITKGSESFVIQEKDQVLLSGKSKYDVSSLAEKLFLGSTKEQDWAMMRRRCDLAEIFPLWMKVGQMIPRSIAKNDLSGVFALLASCKQMVDTRQKNGLIPGFKNLFLAGFHSMLSPRLFDDEYQGIVIEESLGACPLELLSQGSDLIRSMFFQESSDSYSFLPCLPSEFACGRFVHIKAQSGDSIDFIWSKKMMRTVVLRSASSRSVFIEFPSEVKRFRLRKNLTDRGVVIDAGTAVMLEKDQVIFIDKFEK